MKFRILSLARAKHHFYSNAESEFVNRIKQFAKIELVEIDCSKFQTLPNKQRIEREGDLLLDVVGKDRPLVVLDEGGKQFPSEDFSKKLSEWMNSSASTFQFVLGGPLGLSAEVKAAASLLWSLSPLTFTAQMARLLVIEQIYRALSIQRGLPYHRE